MPRICKVFLPLFLLLLVSCRGDGDGTRAPGAAASPSACAGGEILVAAAASLTESFTAIGTELEATCDGARISFTFDSSAALAGQIREGAPVDVFASADEANLAKVADRASGPTAVFARNRLAIVTKPGNPERIASLADLRDADVVALCTPAAPCGELAAEALSAAAVSLDETRVTRAQNAKATLTAVSEGDAEAGIVYVTDALAAGGAVETVPISDDQNVVASYPVAVLDGPGDRQLAETFAAALLEPAAQRVLRAHGFEPPP
jgi:molybdate transport system substrate-binding protein